MNRAFKHSGNRAAIVLATVAARFFHSMTLSSITFHSPPWLTLVTASLLLLSGCEKKETGTIDLSSAAPIVSRLSITPSAVNIDTLTPTAGAYSISSGISVKVSDPDGLQDIREVDYNLFSPAINALVGSGKLAIVNGGTDSVGATFAGRITFTASVTTLGNYLVEAKAVDQSGTTSNILQFGLAVGRNNIPPTFGVPGARQTTASGITPAVFALTVPVIDSNGIADIQRVSVRALNAQDTSSHAMSDNGEAASGDKVSGDGTYSAVVSVIPTGSLQDVIFEFSASDSRGALATSVRRSLRNHPPHFLSVDVPTTIDRPPSGSSPIGFSVTVADSDGLGDIDSVYFRNFTSTTPTNFLMYDDGNYVEHGDLVAGDGKYSLTVSIAFNTSTGPKEFHFYVTDKAGTRDEVIRIITIN